MLEPRTQNPEPRTQNPEPPMTRLSRRQFIERAGLGTVAGLAIARTTTLRADPLGLPIGCQTYPERQQVADGEVAELMKKLYDAGIRQVELCSPGYQQFASLADGKQTKKIITDAGLTCVSSHFTFN